MNRERWVLVLVAVIAVLPAALPGARWYMDNPAHLAEVEAIARHVLPGFVGWVPDLNVGQPLVQQAAPLAWVPLAALRGLGLPLWPLYVAGMLGSQVVYALGALALGRRLLGPGPAALIAAALIACAPVDLYGIAGAAGGMWPFRLANGLLLFLLARPWRAWQQAALLGSILLIHPFTAVVAFAAVLIEAAEDARRGRWDRALAGGCALAVGLLLAGAWLLPVLLEPELRPFRYEGLMDLGKLALLVLLPLEVEDLMGERGLNLLGGWTSLPWILASLAGLATCWRQRLHDPAGFLRLALPTLGLLLAIGLFYAGSDWQPLGPVPWRFSIYGRIVLALLAGAGLASLLVERRALALGVGLALAASMVGHQLLPVGAQDAQVQDSLERTWSALARARPAGVVYQADTFQAPAVATSMAWSHPGGLLYARTGLPVMGAWHRNSPSAAHERAYSEGWRLFGEVQEQLDDEALYAQVKRYGVGAIVTVDQPLRRRLAADPRYAQVAEDGIFAAFLVLEPSPQRVGAAGGQVEVLLDEPTLVRARIGGEAGQPFRLRSSFHPWWSATLDGQPLELVLEERTGLVSGVTGPGLLELRWEDRGAPFRWVSGLGLVALLGLVGLRGRL